MITKPLGVTASARGGLDDCIRPGKKKYITFFLFFFFVLGWVGILVRLVHLVASRCSMIFPLFPFLSHSLFLDVAFIFGFWSCDSLWWWVLSNAFMIVTSGSCSLQRFSHLDTLSSSPIVLFKSLKRNHSIKLQASNCNAHSISQASRTRLAQASSYSALKLKIELTVINAGAFNRYITCPMSQHCRIRILDTR